MPFVTQHLEYLLGVKHIPDLKWNSYIQFSAIDAGKLSVFCTTPESTKFLLQCSISIRVRLDQRQSIAAISGLEQELLNLQSLTLLHDIIMVDFQINIPSTCANFSSYDLLYDIQGRETILIHSIFHLYGGSST